jgi:DNA repair protein RadC
LDIGLIRKLKESGKFIEIQVLDHLIVASEGYPVHNVEKPVKLTRLIRSKLTTYSGAN